MAKYRAKCAVKIRIPVPDNRAGFGWRKQPPVMLEADSIEELADQAYAIPAPEDIDTEAIFVEGTVHLVNREEDKKSRSRRDIQLKVFREL